MDPAVALLEPRDDERPLLLSIPEKYERMRTLRRELGRGQPSPADRERLRSLSAAYPGALRELESLTTLELDERLRAATTARAATTVPAWLLWTAVYHDLMRTLLKARRVEIDRGERPPHGRLNAVVFAALEARFSIAKRTIWDRLFPTRGPAARSCRD